MRAIEVVDLVKHYDKGQKAVEAVKGISFFVKKGEFFALLGPNGAGKSTTIGVLTQLVDKTSGSVTIKGKKLSNDTKREIGLVPQEFNFNIFEKPIEILVNQAGFFGISSSTAHKTAEKLLRKLGLWEKRNTQARMLSGGMKRKLLIARGLMHDPSILILDEPTAGVDVETRRLMWKFMKELNKAGKTIVLTTHYLEEAEQLCTHLAIVHKGLIIQEGPMKQLLGSLQSERFVFDVDKVPKNIEKACKHCVVEVIDDTTIEVELKKGQKLNEVVEYLTSKGVAITSMRNKANRLEELFISLTGEGEMREE